MLKEYYFWKWADNDLPGNPAEVHATLLRGEMHPALQPFNARPLLRRLEKARDEGRYVEEEWDWQLHPQESPGKAHFVFATCPDDGGFSGKFGEVFFPLGLACFDEQEGTLTTHSPPKLNCFISGDFPEVYDVALDDLPVLLQRISSKESPNAFGILMNRKMNFVQTARCGRRFCVEWRENYDIRFKTKFDQWRVCPSPGKEALRVKRLLQKDPDYPNLIGFAATLRIFEAFFRGEPRPEQYCWRNINHMVR